MSCLVEIKYYYNVILSYILIEKFDVQEKHNKKKSLNVL